MKKSVVINNHVINEKKRIFIIAEAGINHNGELDKALQLVDIAASIGADAVKFQTFRTDEVTTDRAGLAKYQENNLGRAISQKEMIKKFELPESDWPKIVSRCQEKGILFLSTPHGGQQSVELLESLGVCAYKIGSADVTNYILLQNVAETHKPVVISSGMSDFQEIANAVTFLQIKGAQEIVALHCTTNYPCKVEDANLAAMITMMGNLNVPVGYSDHTTDKRVAAVAAILGMALYEFHFTIDKNFPGPDHKASANPEEAEARISIIRKIESKSKTEKINFIKNLGNFYSIVLGTSDKKPNARAVGISQVARKSIVASRPLSAGHLLALEDIKAKRPGTGLSPTYFEKLLGKKLKCQKKFDEQILLEDVLP